MPLLEACQCQPLLEHRELEVMDATVFLQDALVVYRGSKEGQYVVW